MKNRKKILIAGTTLGVMLIAAFVISSIRLYLIEKEMPPMQDIYFLEYDTTYAKSDTVIYQYDAQKDVTTKAGRIQGFFFDCKIDRDKNCIIGILAYLPPHDRDAEEEYSVVRYWLEERRLETCVSAETITGLSEGRLALDWRPGLGNGKAGLYNEGREVLLAYYLEKGTEYILYNLETDEYRYVAGEDYGETVFIEDADYECWFLPDNKEKCVYSKSGEGDNLYLYDVRSGKSQCIISTELMWQTYLSEDVVWDESGEYLFYRRGFSRLFYGQRDIMVYNFKTKKSRSIFTVRNPGPYKYHAFVRDVD